MKCITMLFVVVLLGGPGLLLADQELSLPAYRDHLAGGFIGEMVGVCFGAPYEFRYISRINQGELKPWRPERIRNALRQDDLYVELTFLKSLETYGLLVSPAQVGADLAATRFPLWHGGGQARRNLRRGIPPPESGHPRHNPHADDIDFQIHSDLFGLISPGLPAAAWEMGDRFGHILAFGDGVYGGIFIATMSSQAFFESDPETLVRAGLAAIPPESRYARTIADVLAVSENNPEDWEAVWRMVEEKYVPLQKCRLVPVVGPKGIDANVNGAYVAAALLYGRGDPYQTLEIAVRLGKDCDCNAASAMGVLGAALGYERLPAEFKAGLEAIRDEKFLGTGYTWPRALAAMEALARTAVASQGGQVRHPAGEEKWRIPEQEIRPARPFEVSFPPKEK